MEPEKLCGNENGSVSRYSGFGTRLEPAITEIYIKNEASQSFGTRLEPVGTLLEASWSSTWIRKNCVGMKTAALLDTMALEPDWSRQSQKCTLKIKLRKALEPVWNPLEPFWNPPGIAQGSEKNCVGMKTAAVLDAMALEPDWNPHSQNNT